MKKVTLYKELNNGDIIEIMNGTFKNIDTYEVELDSDGETDFIYYKKAGKIVYIERIDYYEN